MSNSEKPVSSGEYVNLEQAFAFFNAEMFNGRLPEVFITLSRKRNAMDFFWAGQFTARHGEDSRHEISLNPELFKGYTDKYLLSVLVHEMVHLWQHEFGQKKPRKGYHNREWADEMMHLGLQPTPTGMSPQEEYERIKKEKCIKDNSPEDNELHMMVLHAKRPVTGQRMSHYILPGQEFDRSCDELLAGGFKIGWESFPKPKAPSKKDKVKYECKDCKVKAWAKPGVQLACGLCGQMLESEDDAE